MTSTQVASKTQTIYYAFHPPLHIQANNILRLSSSLCIFKLTIAFSKLQKKTITILSSETWCSHTPLPKHEGMAFVRLYANQNENQNSSSTDPGTVLAWTQELFCSENVRERRKGGVG